MNWVITALVVIVLAAVVVYTSDGQDIDFGTSTICERGVSYLVIRGYNRLGVSVMFNANGEVVTCV